MPPVQEQALLFFITIAGNNLLSSIEMSTATVNIFSHQTNISWILETFCVILFLPPASWCVTIKLTPSLHCMLVQTLSTARAHNVSQCSLFGVIQKAVMFFMMRNRAGLRRTQCFAFSCRYIPNLVCLYATS